MLCKDLLLKARIVSRAIRRLDPRCQLGGAKRGKRKSPAAVKRPRCRRGYACKGMCEWGNVFLGNEFVVASWRVIRGCRRISPGVNGEFHGDVLGIWREEKVGFLKLLRSFFYNFFVDVVDVEVL